MQTSSISDEMKQTAEYAIKTAKEKFGEILDYSLTSLPGLDKLLAQASQLYRDQVGDKKTSDDVIMRTANIWGSYLGEVIRRKWGGEWNADQDSKQFLLINGMAFSPVLYIYQRITGQERNNIKQYVDEIARKVSSQPINAAKGKEDSKKRIGENNIAIFFTGVACMTYLGGIVAGIVFGNVTVPISSYYNSSGVLITTETEFSIYVALTYWGAAFITGSIFLGFAEVIKLLQKIYDTEK